MTKISQTPKSSALHASLQWMARMAMSVGRSIAPQKKPLQEVLFETIAAIAAASSSSKRAELATLKTYLSKTPFLTLAGEAWLDDLFPSLQGASPKALAQFFQTPLSRRGDLARQSAITSIKIDLLAFFLHQSQWSHANAILDVLPQVAIANLENAIQRPLDDMRRQFAQSWHQGHLLVHEAAAIGFFSPEDISESRASQQTWRRLQEQSLIDPAATKMHPDKMDRRRGFPLVALRDVLHPAFAMRAEIKKVPRPNETAAEMRARFKATMRG